MSSTTPHHNAVTSDEGHSNFDAVARGGDEITSANTTEAPRRSSVVNGQETDYETAHRASLDDLEQRRQSSLSSTPGPFNAATTDDVSKASDAPPSSSVGTQNAPGKVGEIGENVMGAFGYGGAKVERAPEDQGLGEKIVNFLGA